MNTADTFDYRVRRRSGGLTPGAHPGWSAGQGNEFLAHTSLLAQPDPRRLDLRASLLAVDQAWRVRLYRQRSAVPLMLLADVSASMAFGAVRRKLDVLSDFAALMARSARRHGDPAGMLAFDTHERQDLEVPPQLSAGTANELSARLAGCAPGRGSEGVLAIAERLAGRSGLLFLVSDFHWPEGQLQQVLQRLGNAAGLIPLVIWDVAETTPPAASGLLELEDAESSRSAALWMRARVRAAWCAAVARRRDELDDIFRAHGTRAIYLSGQCTPDVMSRYFLEEAP